MGGLAAPLGSSGTPPSSGGSSGKSIFKIFGPAAGQSFSGGTLTLVQWATGGPAYDDDSGYSGTPNFSWTVPGSFAANSRFNVRVALHLNATLFSAGDYGDVIIRIYKNGAPFSINYYGLFSTGTRTLDADCTYFAIETLIASAGDIFTVEASFVDIASLGNSASTDGNCYWEILTA